jgi:hypothetical protein
MADAALERRTLRLAPVGGGVALRWHPDEPQRAHLATFADATVDDVAVESTPDGAFHAVYDRRGVYADVYATASRYSGLEHLFTLRRDDYHTSHFLVAFVRVGDEWRLVFNRRHDGLAVYALPRGAELFRDVKPAEFLGRVVPLPRLLPPPLRAALADACAHLALCASWVWGPYATPALIDLQAVAARGGVGHVRLSADTPRDVRRFLSGLYEVHEYDRLEELLELTAVAAAEPAAERRFAITLRVRPGRSLPADGDDDDDDDDGAPDGDAAA